MSITIRFFCVSIICFLCSCDGTLGGFETITFPTSKKKVEIAFDSIYNNYPKYKIPDNLQEYNFWSKSGYDFLDSRLIYIDDFPSELYYISFVGENQTTGDERKTSIAIRSVFVLNKKKWFKEHEFSDLEKKRIKDKFSNEIILKIENYTKCKAEAQN